MTTPAAPAWRAQSIASRITEIGQASGNDPEVLTLAVMTACLGVLEPGERKRVIRYLYARYGGGDSSAPDLRTFG